jgi:hypothetical protein
MRRSNLSVFNEFITQTASPFYTSSELNARLAQYDQLAIQVVLDNVTASGGTFDLWVEHSADGRNWLTSNPAGSAYGTGTGDVTKGSLSSGGTFVAYGYNLPTSPLLGYVRFRMSLNTATSAHVHVLVTQRDQG